MILQYTNPSVLLCKIIRPSLIDSQQRKLFEVVNFTENFVNVLEFLETHLHKRRLLYKTIKPHDIFRGKQEGIQQRGLLMSKKKCTQYIELKIFKPYMISNSTIIQFQGSVETKLFSLIDIMMSFYAQKNTENCKYYFKAEV